jgi:hypothetical protein
MMANDSSGGWCIRRTALIYPHFCGLMAHLARLPTSVPTLADQRTMALAAVVHLNAGAPAGRKSDAERG